MRLPHLFLAVLSWTGCADSHSSTAPPSTSITPSDSDLSDAEVLDSADAGPDGSSPHSEPEPAEIEDGDGPPGMVDEPDGDGERPNSSLATVRGRLFYDDQRDYGRFDLRRTPDGTVGAVASGDVNYLGAYYVVVDVIERDASSSGSACELERVVASATVGHDGTWKAAFVPGDPCLADQPSTPTYSLRARLRYCNANDFCFSMGDILYGVYTQEYFADAPFSVSAGDSWDVEDLFFGGNLRDGSDRLIRAVIMYEELVDSIVTVNIENAVPFSYEEYGEVHLAMPGWTDSGTTTSYDRIDLQEPTNFPKGTLVTHEYGHIVHRRAQGGNYGGVPDPIQSWNPTRHVDAFIAFKEAWAQLTQALTLGRCAEIDENEDASGLSLSSSIEDGIHYERNVRKFLCDWLDETEDDDASLEGPGDHFSSSYFEMWQSLVGMVSHVDDYGGGNPRDGLDVCDFIDYALEIGGEAEHIDEISDMARNNNIGCPGVLP